MQNSFYDIGWSDEEKRKGCKQKKKARRSTGCTTVHLGGKSENQIPEGLGKWKQRAKTSKEDWKWQRGITSHTLSEVKLGGKTVCQSEGGNLRSTKKLWHAS